MAAESRSSAENAELELVITRILDAPRSVVFKLWTQPEHLMRWWGPRGFTLPSCALDLRPGGAYRFHMRGPDGDDHMSQGVFREVVEPERIVMAGCWADAEGNPTTPQTLLTVIFEEFEGKTRLTLHQTLFDSVSARDAHRGGWSGALDRLGEYVIQLRPA
jgi:uncharacterized protein YndB with AHSA1/START domain